MDEQDWKVAVKMYKENRSIKEIQETVGMSKDRIPELKIRAFEGKIERIEGKNPNL